MSKNFAIIGAGRMGAIIAGQAPKDYTCIVIDRDMEKAQSLADSIGATASSNYADAANADITALVLPAVAVDDAMRALGGVAKEQAIFMNMATNGMIASDIQKQYPQLRYVEAKIVGHAASMAEGAPAYLIIDKADEEILSAVRDVMPGFARVLPGDVAMVPRINALASGEGIRAAVQLRKKLAEFSLPKEWEDIVIYTVCAGTMRSYVQGDLGDFARELAEKLENE